MSRSVDHLSPARCHISARDIERAQQTQRAARQTHNGDASASAEVSQAEDVPPPPVSPDFGTLAAKPERNGSSQVPPQQPLSEKAKMETDAEMCQTEATAGTTAAGDEKPAPTPAVRKNSRTPLTQQEKAQVAVLMSYGHSLRQAAARIGRSHMTISRHLKKDAAFAELVESYRRDTESNALVEVVQASKRSWRAAAWLLQYLERREGKQSA